MKPVIIDSAAEFEVTESAKFYERQRSGLGLEFENAVEIAVEAIRHAPERYPGGKYGTRRFVMQRFPFVIHYRELPNTIWIVAFGHTSREPGYWWRRTVHPPES